MVKFKQFDRVSFTSLLLSEPKYTEQERAEFQQFADRYFNDKRNPIIPLPAGYKIIPDMSPPKQSTKVRKVSRLITAPKSAYRIQREQAGKGRPYVLFIRVFDTVTLAGSTSLHRRKSSRRHVKGDAVLFKDYGRSVVGFVEQCVEDTIEQSLPILLTVIPEVAYTVERTEWGTIVTDLLIGGHGIRAIGWHTCGSPILAGISAEDVWEQLRSSYTQAFIDRAESAING